MWGRFNDMKMVDRPEVPAEDEMTRLLREEDEISDKLARSDLSRGERRRLKETLERNLRRQQDGFYAEIHPKNGNDYRDVYQWQDDEPFQDFAERMWEHPIVNRIMFPLAVIGAPAWVRFYPKYACWRNVHVRPYSKAQMKRRRMIWRRNILHEGLRVGHVERVAFGAMFVLSFILFATRTWEEHQNLLRGKPPMAEEGYGG
jgi:hypothetical protein